MRAEVKEWIGLIGKTLLLIVGGILATAALVEFVVAGYSHLALLIFAGGLLLAVPPLAFAFRDALREARKGRV